MCTSGYTLELSAESQHQVNGRFFLDIIVGEGSLVFKLLTSEDQALLIWGDSFLVLEFLLDVSNTVSGLDFKGDGLSCEGLNENLHTAGCTNGWV